MVAKKITKVRLFVDFGDGTILEHFFKHAIVITKFMPMHSLIRVVLIQSYSARAENFTNYVFCHPQFSGVIQNIENRWAILTPILLCQLLSK